MESLATTIRHAEMPNKLKCRMTVIGTGDYTIYCGDADEGKRAAGVRMRLCMTGGMKKRGLKLWILKARAPTEIAKDNNKDAFYDELNALMS
ncbi:hypothetical protein RB195_020340 [Necator americanus]|uniref:Uncharacterized protein n=1 Tax=Necator americanus TaxID=51031 RepID=A0ABR1CIC1_NECAM